jgi:hypothetical protein
MQNMEFGIPSNGILHHVWPCAFPHEHNKVGVSLSDHGLAANALRKTMSYWMGEAQFGA